MKYTPLLAATTLACTISNFAVAQDAVAEFYGFALDPSGAIDDGVSCGAGAREFCGDVIGWGGYAGITLDGPAGGSVYADLRFEIHDETNSVEALGDEHGRFISLGLHWIDETNPSRPWGVFGVLAGGTPNASISSFGPTLGLGAEIELGGYQVQGGALVFAGESTDDVLSDLLFLGVGREYDLGTGVLDWGLMLGTGDFNNSGPTKDGDWVQFEVTYRHRLGTGPYSILAGYQYDFIDVPDPVIPNEAGFHTVKLGISRTFGGGKGRFETPNFRAPLTTAGDLNGI